MRRWGRVEQTHHTAVAIYEFPQRHQRPQTATVEQSGPGKINFDVPYWLGGYGLLDRLVKSRRIGGVEFLNS